MLVLPSENERSCEVCSKSNLKTNLNDCISTDNFKNIFSTIEVNCIALDMSVSSLHYLIEQTLQKDRPISSYCDLVGLSCMVFCRGVNSRNFFAEEEQSN